MSSAEPTEPPSQSNQSSVELTDELLRKLADEVFRLLKEEARIERERFRPSGNFRRFGQGGR
jgi:hypothetical protein